MKKIKGLPEDIPIKKPKVTSPPPLVNLTLDLDENLARDQVMQRFEMRKQILNEECDNRGNPRLLNGISATENSIYYNDKYKIIACFPLKAGTTNWQTLLAILKSDGKITEFEEKDIYGNAESLRKLAKSLGLNLILNPRTTGFGINKKLLKNNQSR